MTAKLLLDIDELRSLYVDELKTLDEIAVMKHTSKRSIANWLKRAGIPRREHKDRYFTARNKGMVDYFRGWENQSAYIVGYIYADGSIDALNPQSRGVCFSCAVKDREIIDGIAEELALTDSVKVRIVKPSLVLGRYQYGEKEVCSLRFYNNSLVDLLSEYGIEPRKTWINYPMPNVPRQALPHFVRGVFDGDGWVSYKVVDGKERISFGLLGPELFITQLRDLLVSEIGVANNKVRQRPGHFSVAWSTSSDARRLHAFMYPDGEYIHLGRKRSMMQQMSDSQKGVGEHTGRFQKGHPFHPKNQRA